MLLKYQGQYPCRPFVSHNSFHYNCHKFYFIIIVCKEGHQCYWRKHVFRWESGLCRLLSGSLKKKNQH